MRRSFWQLALFSAAACGDPDSNGEGDGEGEGEPGDDCGNAAFAYDLAVGQEQTRCVDVRLDNEDAIEAFRIRTDLSPFSHHLIVYRSTEVDEQLVPYHCFPFTGAIQGKSVPLLISQVANDSVELPAGVAYALGPKQMLRLEMHAINSSGENATATANVAFDCATTPAAEYADLLFYGEVAIEIPPGESATAGPAFLPVDAGTKVFALTGHTHQYGTDVQIHWSESISDPGTPIYQTDAWDWEEPPTTYFDPPLEFGENQGVRFWCDYTNTSDEHVSLGESANDEMCFLWAYYYPADGYKVCLDDDGTYGCCPGSPVCNDLGL